MVKLTRVLIFSATLILFTVNAASQDSGAPGSIRGVVFDKDFDAPLGAANVTIVETSQKTQTNDSGSYVFPEVAPGRYTVIFSKDGYVRQVRAGDVFVQPGQLVDVDASLSGEVTEMEEFIVQETLELEAGTEAALLQLRLESPALVDAISSDFISKAGASDAAAALRLVSGASLQDGKTAVIRGLPDRFVSSQLNNVRLPSADEDKRAVELDQFPAAIIEAIQVAKTFTPDQQGDASGGAVNIRLKGIPKDPFFAQFKSQVSVNTQVSGEEQFLTYRGGGVSFLGFDDGDRDVQTDNIGGNWDGATGVSFDDAPVDHKWSLATGGNHEFDNGLRLGGFASIFYERDSSFYDDGIDDRYWVTTPGAPLTPQTSQGTPGDGDFRTSLFDVTQGTQSVQWGSLTTVGLEYEGQKLSLTYIYTRTTEDTATLAEDTRGKQFFFPGFDPDDNTTPGHDSPDGAPYLRLETLNYVERTTSSFQVNGNHRLPIDDLVLSDSFKIKAPEIDWTFALSGATAFEPDKRQFGAAWFPEREPFPGLVLPATHRPFKPAANFNLGNLQRIFEEIEEESIQYQINLKIPFEQWSGDEGYLKFGYFSDSVERTFNQDSFSNFGDAAAEFQGDFSDFWSAAFPFENHPITESDFDVDYDGELNVTAWYGMISLPLTSRITLVGGARVESTEISIVNTPEGSATWFPPGSSAPTQLNPGDADVSIEQEDILPSIGLEYKPIDEVILRTSFSKTIARQTFKELSPILQQEFLGGPIFIGNPDLQIASVDNFDVRVDWTPYQGALVSGSFFYKSIKDPIEFVQRLASFDYTTPVNFPEGELLGFEFEVRQSLGQFWDPLQGLNIGGNFTYIDAEVQLPDDEIAGFNLPNIAVPTTSRDMTNAPEYLYNLFLTYELETTGTSLSLFYTVQGDTLLVGAGQNNGNFVPDIYATEFDTLNFSLDQKLGEYFKLQFQAKNLTNSLIETVYRSDATGDDVRRSSFTRGIEFSLSLSAEIRF